MMQDTRYKIQDASLGLLFASTQFLVKIMGLSPHVPASPERAYV